MINELTSEILFRCPSCQKLFCTEAADMKLILKSSKTEFQCTDCSEEFYLLNTINKNGLYVTDKVSQNEFISCSKCHFLKNKKSDECPNCGVIETRYKDIIKLENPRLYELNKEWQEVVSDLENDSLHQKFLNLAQSMSALNFAAQKYIDLQKIMGQDQLIEKYLNQIELRLEAVAQGYMSNEKNRLNQSRTSAQSLRHHFFGFEYSIKNMFLLISLMGTFFFIINVLRPFLPSINGLLIAMVVLSLGLWSISKNQSKMF